MEIEAILLGGQDKLEDWVKEEGVPHKALLKIGERSMIDYILEALKNTPQIKKIVLIGDRDIFKDYIDKVDLFLDDTHYFLNNLIKISENAELPYSVFVPIDVPLISSEIYEKTFSYCVKFCPDCYLYVIVINKKDVDEKLPGTKRTYWKLKGGFFKMGNIFLIRKELYPKAIEFGKLLFDARKSPIKLASLFPLWFILKIIFRQATLKDCEKVVVDKIKLKGRAVPIPFPEIAVDVDKKSDYEFVKKILLKKI